MQRDLLDLRSALAAYLPDGQRITSVVPLSTGHSNETYLLEGLDQILRLPLVAAPLLDSYGMAQQARIYRSVGETPGAPPVPTVLVSCDDPSVLGHPFFVMKKSPGEPLNDYQPPPWFTEASPSFRDGLCRQYVETFAGLTRLAPLEVLGPPVSPQSEVRRWRRFAEIAGNRPLVEVTDRLLATPAPNSGPAAPVHGDPKLANLLWSDGQLMAVLDWELAFNGEPLFDLAYMLHFFESETHAAATGFDLPGMWRRDRVLAEWEAKSGRSADGVAWFEAATAAKIASILAHGHHLYVTGQSRDERFLAWKEGTENLVVAITAMLDDGYITRSTKPA